MYVVQLAFVIGVELPLYYGFYTQTVNNICVMYSLHNMRAVTVGALASVPWVPGTHEFEYLVRYWGINGFLEFIVMGAMHPPSQISNALSGLMVLRVTSYFIC